MYSEAAISTIKSIQAALKVITVLQLTAYMWPEHTIVKDGTSFDYIVVGAGTAGSVVANRLTDNLDNNVLLIEAGGDPPLESDIPATMLILKRSNVDWNYTSTHNPYIERCHQNPFFEMTQGKMLGGTSSLNYLNYGRGLPQDYDSWADLLKDPTWKWSNILPYFKNIERIYDPDILHSPEVELHGTTGSIGVTINPSKAVDKFLTAHKELGNHIEIDLDENHPVGYSKLMLTIADGSRQSSAYSYLRPVKNRPNLHVMKNTLVTKILFDENNNAIGVQALTKEGKLITLKATKEVILSAGAFNTPKLLMLSGIGPKAHLESKGIPVISDLPVGQKLQDHVAISMVYKLDKLDEKEEEVRNPHDSPAPPILGHVTLNNSETYYDYLTLSFLVNADMMLRFCAFGYRHKYDICDTYYQSGSGKTVIYHQVINPHPKSRGEVLLRSTNPEDPPLIDVGYFSNEEDIDNIIRYVSDFSAVVNTTYYRSLNAELIDPTASRCNSHEIGSVEYWRCYSLCMLTGISNYAGTCSMGTVVDNRLRVFGVQRLRIADASVMPTILSSHPMTTIVVIAEKLADFLKDDYSTKTV